MVVNSCFEDLEGGVGLKGVGEFVPEAGVNRAQFVNVKYIPSFDEICR